MAFQKRKTNTTPTMLLLRIEYGDVAHLRLEDIAEKVLGLSITTAQRKANSHELPFNAFKAFDSNKSPYLIDLRDLADYFDERRNAAKEEWLKAKVA